MQRIAVPAEGRDGGIAPLGDGALLVSRNGQSWFVDQAKELHSLQLRIPVNVEEFESDPFNADTVSHERFGVKDILVESGSFGVRILASHIHWYPERDCYVLRVSGFETTYDKLVSAASGDESWRTLMETTPCRSLNVLKGGKRAVTLGAGGRLVALSENEFLLSVGGFGPESEAIEGGKESEVTDSENDSYGKTILFDFSDGDPHIYTRGHRNPQGLAVGSDARVWLTEHGPQGGDELNQLVEGLDYGWPHVTYGTEYEMMTWPGNPQQGRHEAFEKPMFAWVPAIGISQLQVIEKNAFPNWHGDLLVSSLKSMSLFRVRIEDDRVKFVEPMAIGHRIRDIAELANGAILLKTEDNFLVYLEPALGETMGGAGASSARGEILATQCQGCHSLAEDGVASIGPSLWGVVGRRIASAEGFPYSDGLKAARQRVARGRWTTDTLRTFLKDPQSFAPGTTMEVTAQYSEAQISDLIAYLETRQ